MWANIAFAMAVFGGALGCVALMLKKQWAQNLFMISLLGVIVQLMHAFFIADSFAMFGPGAVIMPVMVVAVAIFLLQFSRSATRRGWLN